MSPRGYLTGYTFPVNLKAAIVFLAAVALIVVATLGYSFLNSKEDYTFASVTRGTIVQEVSASGRVEPPTQIDLHFKGSGKIVSRNVDVGDRVEEGDVLIRQSASELNAQLGEIEAGVEVQKARLAQLLAGSSAEDIRIAETAVLNAQKSIQDKQSSLLKALQDAYTTADDAVRTKADVVFSNPQSGSPQLNFSISNQQVELSVEQQRVVVESALSLWKNRAQAPDDVSANAALDDIAKVMLLLDYVAQTLNFHVTGQSQTTLDTWKTSVSAARTSVNTARSVVVSAVESLNSAEGVLNSAENTLALKKAPARSEDIALYQAQIRQAEAASARIEAQIAEMRITAPVDGIVTKVEGEVGEIIGADVTAVSLTPVGALQIKLNVSENNIANVVVGQKVRITLDAFSDGSEWQGAVIAVDPAETLSGGAVYYLTTVLFDTEDQRVKSGMTANAWITTATKENALSVPVSAIIERDGAKYVNVRAGSGVREQMIQTGITGKQGMVEVTGGLSGGEEIVVGRI